MRDDWVTNTVEDAGDFERRHNTPPPDRVDPRDVLSDDELADYFREKRGR